MAAESPRRQAQQVEHGNKQVTVELSPPEASGEVFCQRRGAEAKQCRPRRSEGNADEKSPLRPTPAGPRLSRRRGSDAGGAPDQHNGNQPPATAGQSLTGGPWPLPGTSEYASGLRQGRERHLAANENRGSNPRPWSKFARCGAPNQVPCLVVLGDWQLALDCPRRSLLSKGRASIGRSPARRLDTGQRRCNQRPSAGRRSFFVAASLARTLKSSRSRCRRQFAARRDVAEQSPHDLALRFGSGPR